uniref:Proline-rich transmembrane protein 1-like n=1 Tax=Crassostrea virginica TaxID=6565 RepID=A0A8B8AB12_CRAVI|nr:proline-rich transmembrane protein 1-like [Crassostrea virginica]
MDYKTYSPPSYTQAKNPYDQANFSGSNQYNHYPTGYEYPPRGQNPGYNYGERDSWQRHDTTTVVTQTGPVPMVIEPVPHCDWMIPAVLTCLCCFWPTGICAIISASKANAAAARGDVTETHRLSSKARSLVIASFALGIIITGIVVTYRLLLARRYYQ